MQHGMKRKPAFEYTLVSTLNITCDDDVFDCFCVSRGHYLVFSLLRRSRGSVRGDRSSPPLFNATSMDACAAEHC